jgi:hypothetical protein
LKSRENNKNTKSKSINPENAITITQALNYKDSRGQGFK